MSLFPIPKMFLAGMLSILVIGCSAPPPSDPVTPCEGWKLVNNKHFSFAIPESFKEVGVQGIDSFVGQFMDDGIMLTFDYGMYSDNFRDWPAETKYKTIKIGNETARIGSRETKDLPEVSVLTQAYVKENSRHSNLAMGANCRDQKQADLAHKIFETIRFQ